MEKEYIIIILYYQELLLLYCKLVLTALITVKNTVIINLKVVIYFILLFDARLFALWKFQLGRLFRFHVEVFVVYIVAEIYWHS